MTTRIDRLTGRGLVTRRADPGDRRLVVVELTEEGLQQVDAAMASLLERESSFLAGMPRRDRDRLADLLRALVRPFEPPG